MDGDLLLSVAALYVFLIWALGEFSNNRGDRDG